MKPSKLIVCLALITFLLSGCFGKKKSGEGSTYLGSDTPLTPFDLDRFSEPLGSDSLVFEDNELPSDADLALQFQAISNMPDEEQDVIKQLLEGMIIKYEAQRWSSRAK